MKEEDFLGIREQFRVIPEIPRKKTGGILLDKEEARLFVKAERERNARELSAEVPKDSTIEQDLMELQLSLQKTAARRHEYAERKRPDMDGKVSALKKAVVVLPYAAETRLF